MEMVWLGSGVLVIRRVEGISFIGIVISLRRPFVWTKVWHVWRFEMAFYPAFKNVVLL